MRVHVDDARENCGLAQINDSNSRRNLDLTLRSDVRDSIAPKKHNLVRQHLPALAVKQAARADRDDFGSRGAFIRADIRRPHARLRTHPPPWSLLAGSLRGLSPKPLRHNENAENRHVQSYESHHETI